MSPLMLAEVPLRGAIRGCFVKYAHIGTGAKSTARSSDNDRSNGIAGHRAPDRRGELAFHLHGPGIQLGGAVERDGSHGPGGFVQNFFVHMLFSDAEMVGTPIDDSLFDVGLFWKRS